MMSKLLLFIIIPFLFPTNVYSQLYSHSSYLRHLTESTQDSITGQKGIGVYIIAIKQDSKNAENWYNLGIAYEYIADSLKRRRYADNYDFYIKAANKAFFKAKKLKENFAAPYYKIGYLWEMQDNDKKAIKYYSKAINRDSTKAQYYYRRGVCREYDPKLRNIKDFSKAIALDSTFADAYFERSDAYKNIRNKNNRGWNMEGCRKAAADLTIAIRLEPNNPVGYCMLAYIYRLLDDWEAVLADYDEGIRANPTSYELYECRASSKYNHKDEQGACEDWKKAVELGSKSAKTYIEKLCK